MKTFIQILALGLTMMSCTVYKSQPVSLERASELAVPSKVKRESGDVAKFKKIIVKDDEFYGVQTKNSKQVFVRLDPEDLQEVKIKNRKMSTAVSIAIPVIVGGIIIVTATEDALSSGFE